MKCICCEKIIQTNRKFCNNFWQKEAEYRNYIQEWKSGNKDGMRGKFQISLHIQRYLYEKYNGCCSKCGWHEINPYTKKCPLEIEHIDGNYLNNAEVNLTLLCPNCHSLTSTYKGANKGNGRKDRKKYSLYGNPELGQNDRV